MGLYEKLDKLTLKSRVIRCLQKDIMIYYTDNLDGILDEMTEEDFGEDERFPYFLNIWDSGVELAEYLLESGVNLNGKTILELGSGTGVAGIAVATAGCRIIFSDYEEYSLRLCKMNADLNGLSNYRLLQGDWRNFPPIEEKVDAVICSDVLYENKHVVPLFSVIKHHLTAGITAYIADPGRGHIDTFLHLIKDDGFNAETVYEHTNMITSLRNIKVYKLTAKK